VSLAEKCEDLESTDLRTRNAWLFDIYDIPVGYPWRDKTTNACNMYGCLDALVKPEFDLRVLEIGTGWGISGLMWLRRTWRKGRLVSLDCGNFEGQDNIKQARTLWATKCGDVQRYRQYQVNTQLHTFRWPKPYQQGQPWIFNTALIVDLHRQFDVLFIDGDHGSDDHPWALFNDLWQFWPFLKPGGLCICDDMHDPADYPPRRFPWLSYTWASFHHFEAVMAPQIEDRYIWKYPYVPSGSRPVGLLRKV
jgi:predicted O-methyltransferase YrrM